MNRIKHNPEISLNRRENENELVTPLMGYKGPWLEDIDTVDLRVKHGLVRVGGVGASEALVEC